MKLVTISAQIWNLAVNVFFENSQVNFCLRQKEFSTGVSVYLVLLLTKRAVFKATQNSEEFLGLEWSPPLQVCPVQICLWKKKSTVKIWSCTHGSTVTKELPDGKNLYLETQDKYFLRYLFSYIKYIELVESTL